MCTTDRLMPPGQYVLANDAKNKTEKAFCLQDCAIMTAICWLLKLQAEHVMVSWTSKDFQTVYEETFDVYVMWPLTKILQNWIVDCTEVRFASFLSSELITAIVVNSPERKLAKHTSVDWSTARDFTVCMYLSQPTLYKMRRMYSVQILNGIFRCWS